MRVVIQRVTSARVLVGDEVAGAIGRGLVLLAGIADGDDAATAERLAQKCCELRIFPDDEGRFDRSLLDTGGEALVVSQFTLLADTRRGRRPSFTDAAPPDVAAPLVDAFAAALRALGVKVATGRFGASMQVELVNDGPVTIVLDSADFDAPRRG
jgi:D-tyrosyl-tRNA(Tyr) deacylase